jgi:FkbM family methyltransferase
MFVKLTENYATEAQLQFENAAIAKQNREASLFRFRIDAPIRDCDHGVATFNEEQIRRRARERRVSEEYVERVSVPCLTYDDLIAKHGIKSTTLLQIDTEGYDFEVLKMALSSRVLPDIINYEFVHLSLGDRLASCQLLAEHNYSLFHSSFDTLALHNAESEFTDAV